MLRMPKGNELYLPYGYRVFLGAHNNKVPHAPGLEIVTELLAAD